MGNISTTRQKYIVYKRLKSTNETPRGWIYFYLDEYEQNDYCNEMLKICTCAKKIVSGVYAEQVGALITELQQLEDARNRYQCFCNKLGIANGDLQVENERLRKKIKKLKE